MHKDVTKFSLMLKMNYINKVKAFRNNIHFCEMDI